MFFTDQKSRTTGRWSLLRRPSIPGGAMTTEFYENIWSPKGIDRLSGLAARLAALGYL